MKTKTRIARFSAKDPETGEASILLETWSSPKMSCVISRNCAQPIPHHASANAVIVTELVLDKTRLPVGHRMFPEMFSSSPDPYCWLVGNVGNEVPYIIPWGHIFPLFPANSQDLPEWAVMDRRIEAYSRIWTRIRTCQVHATAASSDAYTPPSPARHVRWVRKDNEWHFQCQVDVLLSPCSWVRQGDLAVVRLEREEKVVDLRGTVLQAKPYPKARDRDDSSAEKTFNVQVELCENSQTLREELAIFVDAVAAPGLYFISVQGNEKKSIQMLETIPASPPLQNMRLTVPRTSQQQKRELEMRPLMTPEQVRDLQ